VPEFVLHWVVPGEVKDDVAGSLPTIGQEEHRDEHLLYAEQVFVGGYVLESAMKFVR